MKSQHWEFRADEKRKGIGSGRGVLEVARKRRGVSAPKEVGKHKRE